MIDRTTLDRVTTIVTHDNCPDGKASAILLHDALIGADVVFVQHGTVKFDQLEAKPGMLFCDVSPPEARVQEFIDAGAVVLDHHAKQKHVVEAFGVNGVYGSEKGVSGALLAFREVWAYTTTEGSPSWNRARVFAELAGVRDTWMTDDKRWLAACAQSEALRFYPWSSFEVIDVPFRDGAGTKQLSQLMELGPILMQRQEHAVTKIINEAYGRKTARGTHVMMLGTLNTSDVAEAVRVNGVDVVIGFQYQADGKGGLQLVLSCRSHKLDVGEFCKTIEGGGHRGAAGGRMKVDYDAAINPYRQIFEAFDLWEQAT